MTQLQKDSQRSVIGLGWTDKCQLVVCYDDNIQLFSYKGHLISIHQLATGVGIKEMKMCPNDAGLVVLCKDNKFIWVPQSALGEEESFRFHILSTKHLDEPRIVKGQAVNSSVRCMSSIFSWAILMQDREIEVCGAHSTIYLVLTYPRW